MPESRLTRGDQVLFSLAAGSAVGSNYLVQPLLATVVADLSVTPAVGGLLITISQLGYLAGLLLLVPLGDVADRRLLVGILMATTSAGLALASLAPAFAWLAAALALVGMTTVVAQVLVSFAADLSGDRDRGRSIGTVMAGLILGVLLARTFAGGISELGGWRSVYATTAVVVAATGTVLWRRLPHTARRPWIGYRPLMASIVRLFAERPVLRFRAICGAVSFAGFSVLWSTLALMLARPPYEYSDGVIGLFALAGALGVGAATVAGRISDRGHGVAATGLGLTAGCVAFALLVLGERSLTALIAGIVLLDFAVPFVQILNQAEVYADGAGVRSRLTTAYMGIRFMGGALGSAVGVVMFAHAGWWSSSALGFAFFSSGLVAWVIECRGRRRRLRERAISVRPGTDGSPDPCLMDRASIASAEAESRKK